MQRTRDLIPLAAARQLSLALLVALPAPAAALALSVARTPASAAASPAPASLSLRSFDEACRIVREQFFELLAYTIKHRDYGPLVGAHTAGAVTGGAPFLLPNGSLLYVAVADIAIEGRRMEGVGVAPDIAVPFPLPYAVGADPQLERAIKEAERLLP